MCDSEASGLLRSDLLLHGRGLDVASNSLSLLLAGFLVLACYVRGLRSNCITLKSADAGCASDFRVLSVKTLLA